MIRAFKWTTEVNLTPTGSKMGSRPIWKFEKKVRLSALSQKNIGTIALFPSKMAFFKRAWRKVKVLSRHSMMGRNLTLKISNSNKISIFDTP